MQQSRPEVWPPLKNQTEPFLSLVGATIRFLPVLCITLVSWAPDALGASVSGVENYDVVIYGGTAAAVTAAVQAKRMHKTVVIVSPDKHLGGLSSGALVGPIRATRR